VSYTWYIQNKDRDTIQFCVVQSGGYYNCTSIPGNSTQTFVIPDSDVQIYGTPTGYYVYYTSVQVKTGTKSLPPSGSTITVPAYTGCDPLLTQGQGYPPLVPCSSPIIYMKSESTPAMFIENSGADPAGFSYFFGVAGSQLGIATGPGWAYYRQYPAAQVYLIGNWRVTPDGNYYDEDSGRTYCGCKGKSVYVIPTSALPGPSSGTGSSGTGSSGTGSQTTGTTQTTGQQTTPTTGVLHVANQCSTGVVVNAGGKTAYAPPYHAITLEVPIPTNYTLISQGQLVGKGTVYQSGEYVSPQTCPSSPSPTPTPSPSPSGGTSTQTTTSTTTSTTTPTTPSQVPWGVLLILVILGVIALSS